MNQGTAGRFKVGRLAFSGGGQVASGSTAPLSGTSGTPLGMPRGSVYVYTGTTGPVVYTNEGTATSPYWTPVHYDQPGLRGWHTDFRDGIGEALADTDAALLLARDRKSTRLNSSHSQISYPVFCLKKGLPS